MIRWSALAALLAIACAVALRAPKLDLRPLHNDEAVNAVKVAELWEHGRYKYDPDEYHGPTLHYATVPFLRLSGARHPHELADAALRFATVAFGVGFILLLPLFTSGLGRGAVAWAALFTAISPAMVFYSRYFIHEMLLVFFTALTLGAGWRYAQTRSVTWMVMTGLGLGLMFATKETFVLTVAAMGFALMFLAWRDARAVRVAQAGGPNKTPTGRREENLAFPWTLPLLRRAAPAWQIPLRHLGLGLLSVLIVWLLFFSSFFSNFEGLADSIRTYFPWLKRAGGDSPHIHPWYFYLQRLGWFSPPKSPVWSEGLILGLAIVGGLVAFSKNGTALLRFLTLYTVSLTAIYSVISYKTPWCLLNFYIGMILLAGAGAAALIRWARPMPIKILTCACLVALVGQLAFQAWRASFGASPEGRSFASDRRNPYVYAQTLPDLTNLVRRVEGVAGVAPAGYNTLVKVIAAGSDYWPLPWHFRRFKHVGWYDRVPEDAFAPIVVASAALDLRLDEKSGKKWVMVGISELRPQTFLELYVELELWKKYVETLPRPKDDE